MHFVFIIIIENTNKITVDNQIY